MLWSGCKRLGQLGRRSLMAAQASGLARVSVAEPRAWASPFPAVARRLCSSTPSGEMEKRRREYSSGTDLGSHDIAILKKHGAYEEGIVERVEESMRQAHTRLQESTLKGRDMSVECVGVTVDPNVGFINDTLNPNIRLAFTAEHDHSTLRLRYRSKIHTFGPKIDFSLRAGNCMLLGPSSAIYCIIPPVVEIQSGLEIGFGVASVTFLKSEEWPGRYLVLLNDNMGLNIGISQVTGGVLYLDHNQAFPTEQLRESTFINGLLGQWSKAIAWILVIFTVWTKISTLGAASGSVGRLRRAQLAKQEAKRPFDDDDDYFDYFVYDDDDDDDFGNSSSPRR